MNEDIFLLALQGATAGGGFAGSFIFFRWLANFIAGRVDKKEARLDAHTQTLIDRLERRLGAVETQLAECLERHAEEAAARMRLEALLQAKGEIANKVQTIVAAEKMEGKK